MGVLLLPIVPLSDPMLARVLLHCGTVLVSDAVLEVVLSVGLLVSLVDELPVLPIPVVLPSVVALVPVVLVPVVMLNAVTLVPVVLIIVVLLVSDVVLEDVVVVAEFASRGDELLVLLVLVVSVMPFRVMLRVWDVVLKDVVLVAWPGSLLVPVPVCVVTVLLEVTLPFACDALPVTEALEDPVVGDAAVAELTVEVAVEAPRLELLLPVIVAFMLVPAPVVPVLLEVALPLVCDALLVVEALGVPVVDGDIAVVELTVEVAIDVALPELVLAVVAVLVLVPVPVVIVLIAVTLPLVGDALLVPEAPEGPVVGDAVVVVLTVELAMDVPLPDLVLAVVVVLLMVPVRVVAVLPVVTLPLA